MRNNPHTRLFFTSVAAFLALSGAQAFSQTQNAPAKGIVSLRFCCTEENAHCRPELLKKNSDLFFVDNSPVVDLDDIAAAKVNAYYDVPRYDLKFDKDGSEIATVVNFNDFRVLLSFTDAGSKKITEMMTRNPNKQIAILFDKNLVMVLKTPFPVIDGALEVAGDFTEKGARIFVEDINNAIAGRRGHGSNAANIPEE
jgi:preprotein translocase subunit SecD